MQFTFKQFLQEADLTGNSRSGQKSNWDTYIVDDPEWADKDYEVEKNGVLYDSTLKNAIGEVSKGETLKILSLDLMKLGSSSFANVLVSDNEGYLNIGAIKKPSSKNTKDFTPDKLGIKGRKFNADELVSAVTLGLKELKISNPIFEFLEDCMSSVVNKNLFEGKVERFSKNIKLSGSYNFDKISLKKFSKNFGEILGGLFILKTDKSVKIVEYPSKINEGLYDFVAHKESGQKIYYSSKAGNGSASALKNLNVFIPYISSKFSKDNVEKIKLLITGKNRPTIDVIVDYINDFEPNLSSFINNELGIKSSKLTHSELSNWWSENASQMNEEKIKQVFSKIYDKIGYDFDATAMGSLISIFSAKKDTSKNGYILYPLGSYIARTLNEDPVMLKLLNEILTMSYLSGTVFQVNADMFNDHLEFGIIRFKNNQFQFNYHAGMKYPGNVPLAFKEI